MKIDSIIIKEFKSIKQEVQISFSNSLITLIGKNGSGKTNLLQAINQVFDKNTIGYQYTPPFELAVKFKLSKKEFEHFMHDISLDEDQSLTISISNLDSNKFRIKSDFVSIRLKRFSCQAQNAYEQIEKSLNEYINALEMIEYQYGHSSMSIDTYIIQDVDRNSISYSTYFLIDHIKSAIKSLIERINDYIQRNFVEDMLIIEKYSYRENFTLSENITLYKVQAKNITLSPLLSKCISIDQSMYQKLVEDINLRLEESYQKAIDAINIFRSIVEEVRNIVSTNTDNLIIEHENRAKKYETLIDKVKTTMSKNCFFLDNENSILYGTDTESRRYRNQYKYNAIISGIENHLHMNSILVGEETLQKFDSFYLQKKNKIIESTNVYLSNVIASFDKDKIRSIFSVHSENGFQIKIEELDGKVIDIENTSLGRRWYLMFYFIKSQLNKGDIMLIDEPASFLHPLAQQDILKDIVSISKRNTVIISTHSPYMLSNESKYYETMITNDGTIIKDVDSQDLFHIKEIIGFDEYTNILFDSKKKHLLVEGFIDMEVITKFMQVFNIDRNQYNIFHCDGLNMPSVCRFLESYGRDFIALIDADHYDEDSIDSVNEKHKDNKPYANILSNSMYFIDFIKKAKLEKNRYIFVGLSIGGKEIEDLFDKEDKRNLLNNYKKIDRVKFKRMTKFSDRTMTNFRKLFFEMGIVISVDC